MSRAERRFRVVLAGCGRVAWAWLELLLAYTNCELVALVDPVADRATQLAGRYGLACPRLVRLEDALVLVQANLVVDLSPPDQRLAVATAAARAGCPVLAEKPLAVSLVDGLAIAETMAKANLSYTVMQNRRYYPGLLALRLAAAEGLVGEVGLVAVDMFRDPHPGGFRERMPQPLLWDMGIHAFDAARFLLGADAVSVSAVTANPSWSWYAGEATANCTFEMSNGAFFAYRGSMCAAGFSTSFNGAWRVVGSRGTVCWDGQSDEAEVELACSDRFRRKALAPPTAERRLDDRAALGSYHGACFYEMMSALEAKTPSATDIYDNLRSVAMVEGAVASAERGCIVRLDELGPLPRRDREGLRLRHGAGI